MISNKEMYSSLSFSNYTHSNPTEYVLLIDTLTYKSDILHPQLNHYISLDWFLLPIVLICTIWGFWVKGCIDEYRKKKK